MDMDHSGIPSNVAGNRAGVQKMPIGLPSISSVVNGGVGAVNAGVNAAGALAQGAASIGGNAHLQSAVTDQTGDSKSVEAQRAASEKADINGAKLIKLQSEATAQKQTMDVLNAIQSGKDDSVNKKISSTAANAKGISY